MRSPLVLRSLISSTLFLFGAAVLPGEDRLILSDGRTIDGTYLGGDAQEVRLLYGATELVMHRNSVQRIELAAKTPVTAPPASVQPIYTQAPQPVYAQAQQPVYAQAQQPVFVQQAAPAPQILYAPAPQPQIVYVQAPAPAPQPSSVWYVGTGWYGNPWSHHHRPCYVDGWHGWRPGLTIGFEGRFGR